MRRSAAVPSEKTSAPRRCRLATRVSLRSVGDGQAGPHRQRQLPRERFVSVLCTTSSSEAKLTGLTLEELKERLEREIGETEWFVNGRVNRRLFSTAFRFRDPSVRVNSIEEYASGVARLFDPATTMDIISTKITGEREIEIVWRLEATISFPFKPKIKAYYVTTYFRTDEEGLICFQEDFFSVNEWELLLSIFFPNLGTPPAPPVDKN